MTPREARDGAGVGYRHGLRRPVTRDGTEPAVDVDDRSGHGGEPVGQQRHARARHRLRVGQIPPQRRPIGPCLLELREPGDRLGGHGLERPGRDEVGADAVLADVAREVAVRRLQPRLRNAHPVVRGPRHASVEVQADVRGAGAEHRQACVSRAPGRTRSTCSALPTSSHDVPSTPLPRAEAGAKPMGCSTPSRPSTCSPTRLGSSRRSSAEVASSAMTGGLPGRRRAMRVVRESARPKPVSTTVAPCAAAVRATDERDGLLSQHAGDE
jgi:hypothetical protein